MANKADGFAASLGYSQDMLQYVIELGATDGLFYSEYSVFADRIANLQRLV